MDLCLGLVVLPFALAHLVRVVMLWYVVGCQVVAQGPGAAKGAVSVRSLCAEQRGLYEVLVVRALRKDRLMAAMEAYVTQVLGQHFPWRGAFQLQEVSPALQPLSMTSVAGRG